MDEPLDEHALRVIIRAALEDGVVHFGKHSLVEMEKDELCEQDCRNVLRGGVWDGCDWKGKAWRYRVRTPRMVVVVEALGDTELFVVTAWRER